ncbi:MAG: GGDEF domain-containing protein [Clostridiales bacterium]|nr:GGDEF domain-containing protein [Clostridiales bacterium]
MVVDFLGRVFNGLPGDMNLLSNIGFNLLLYLLVPLAPSIWLLYTEFQINGSEIRLVRIGIILSILFVANAALSFASLANGWYFSVDSANMYTRGSHYWIHAVYCCLLVIYSFFHVLFNRKNLETKYYISLLFFFFPASVGAAIQIFHYGVSYIWAGMMLSLLIIFFYIQDRGLNTDYLTGAYNRRQLDRFIRHKMRNSRPGRSFSAIMLDMVEFKKINDQFGHDIGDQALKEAVTILRKSLRQDDFIARYGGDEFVVILDVDTKEILEQTIIRFMENADEFNKSGRTPYKITFSVGYSIYDPSSEITANLFLRQIDKLMYEDKRS